VAIVICLSADPDVEAADSVRLAWLHVCGAGMQGKNKLTRHCLDAAAGMLAAPCVDHTSLVAGGAPATMLANSERGKTARCGLPSRGKFPTYIHVGGVGSSESATLNDRVAQLGT
jgi:hypothetical protein